MCEVKVYSLFLGVDGHKNGVFNVLNLLDLKKLMFSMCS